MSGGREGEGCFWLCVFAFIAILILSHEHAISKVKARLDALEKAIKVEAPK